MIAIGEYTISALNDLDYYEVTSSDSMVVIEDENFTPEAVTFTSKHRLGNGNLEAYSGRFKIETSKDGETWETKYTSSGNESAVEYELPSALEDKVPYLFRKSVGGDRAIEEIVGGSVVWNQMVNHITKTDRGITSTYDSTTNMYTLNGTSTGTYAELFGAISTDNTHTYLTIGRILSNPNNVSIISGQLANIGSYIRSGIYTMFKPADTKLAFHGITGFASGTDLSGIKMMYVAFDLTTMFGTQIADYIYSLEQSSAGSGIAKLKSWGFFTKDYYPYCLPTIRSVSGLVEKRCVGFNQWDEEWELGRIDTSTGNNANSTSVIRSKNYIPCIPSTSYCFKKEANVFARMFFYDKEYNFISTPDLIYTSNTTSIFEIPNGCYYMRFVYNKTSNNEICINISDSTKNGAYEPYEVNTYSLDSSLELRGIFKLDSDNNLYADGDIYPPSGNVENRYGVVDLGELNWSYLTNYTAFVATITGIKRPSAWNTTAPKLSVVYKNMDFTSWESSTDNLIMASPPNADTVFIKNSAYTDASTFKTAMSGVYLLYEKATPTTFTALHYHNPQELSEYGTEEFVTTGIIPVGHNTKYPANIKNIRCSLYKPNETPSATTLLDQITVPIVSGLQYQPFVQRTVFEWALSSSSTELDENTTWAEQKPKPTQAQPYLWERSRNDYSNGTHTYSDAHCDVTISGVISDVDKINGQITNKIWQSDITTSINSYDGTTVSNIRDRVSTTEQNLTGITTRVGAVESTTGSLGTRMTAAESSISQNADKISLVVDSSSSSSSLVLTDNAISAMTNQFVVKDPTGSSTIISGGRIHVDAIKSTNYVAPTTNATVAQGDIPTEPYSVSGSFLNLSNGNFITPNFVLDNTSGDAYFSGAVNATALHVGNSNSSNHLIYENNTIDLQTDWLRFDNNTSTVTIGEDNVPRVKIDGQSMSLMDKDDNVYFKIGDMRVNGMYVFTTSKPDIVVTGVDHDHTPSYYADASCDIDENYDVKVFDEDDVELEYSSISHVELYGKIIGRVWLTKTSLVTDSIIKLTYTTTSGIYNFRYGDRSTSRSDGVFSVCFSKDGETNGSYAFAVGKFTEASGVASFSSGLHSKSTGEYSHAEGYYTEALNSCSHAEGFRTVAEGGYSHAEGCDSVAHGFANHAEGYECHAYNGGAGHAEGWGTKSYGNGCHSEGWYTVAEGSYSHAEGYYTKAEGYASHTGGTYTRATRNYQTVIGQYNANYSTNTIFDSGNYAFIIGNGTDNNKASRSNALTVDWNGNLWCAGSVSCTGITSTGAISGTSISCSSVTSTGSISGTTISCTGITNTGNISCVDISCEDITATGKVNDVDLYCISTEGTLASSNYQTAIGKYNIEDTNNTYALIIGNGEDEDSRSNAFTIDWNGRMTTYNPNLTAGTAPSSTNSNIALCLADKSGNRIGDISYYYSDTDVSGILMNAYRKVNDENKYNALRLSLDSSGNPVVSVSSPTAWRSALDIFHGVYLGKNVAITGSTTGTTDKVTTFTATYTGWISAEVKTDSGVTLAPYLQARDNNNIVIDARWGVTANGASLNVGFPVIKGEVYNIRYLRSTLNYIRLFY